MITEATNDPMAQTRPRRRRLGVFIEWVHDGYSDPIVDEIVIAARESDIDVLCFVDELTYEDFPITSRHRPFAYATSNNIDAALVVTTGNTLRTQEIEKYFARLEPLPIAGVAIRWTKYPKVMVDNESGVRDGVHHLIATHAKRRIACIRGPEVSLEADARFKAYKETLAEHHLEYDPRLVAVGSYIKAHGSAAVRLWLDERKLSFDAIVAANDAMAKGALEELQRRGIDVPEQVALLGFDDIDEARFWRPSLSTIRQPIRDHARKTFDLVMAMLDGKDVPRTSSVLSQFVVRRSCGCAGPARRSRGAFSGSDMATVPIGVWARSSIDALLAFAEVPSPKNVADASYHLANALGGDRLPFVNWLECLLDDCTRRHIDILGIFGVLSEVRHATHCLADVRDVECAHSVLDEANSIVATVAERFQALHRYRHEDLFVELAQTNEALTHAVDLPSLQRILAENLSRFGIRSCYLCKYEVAEGGVPATYARLVLACNTAHAVELALGGLRFPAQDILPSPLMHSASPTTWLICALMRYQPAHAGYFVIERGAPEGFLYEGLLQLLASAYQRIELLNHPP